MSGQRIDYGIGIGSRSNGFLQMSVLIKDADILIKIATIDELKKNSFNDWFEVGIES